MGQYQLVLTTKKPEREYIRMEVGMDAGWAKDVATEVIDAIKGKTAIEGETEVKE